MNDSETISVLYGHLPDGSTAAGELCPVCQGGRTRERTLSVSRKGTVLAWYCHRASCGWRGSTSSRKIPSILEATSCRGFVGRDYVRNATEIPSAYRDQLSTQLFLTDRHISKWQLGWDEQSSRLVQPVFSPEGEVLGCQLRSLDGQQPKAISHTEQGAISWYINRATSELIIVEDIFSAIRVADYCSSVALLSTHINDERIAQIRKLKFGRIRLALDRDAWSKTIAYTKQFRNQLSLEPMRIMKDFKNMNPDELQETLDVRQRISGT